MTANVYPYPSDLPAGSHPFARETIKRVESLERLRASDLTSSKATDKGLAASMSSLASQVYELSQRKAEGATDVNYSYRVESTDTLPATGPSAVPVTITLNERRLVYISTRVTVRLYSTYDGGNVFLNPRFDFQLQTTLDYTDGRDTTNGFTSVYVAQDINAGQRTSIIETREFTFNTLANMGDGTFTAAFRPYVNQVQGTTANITFSAPRTVVQVLGETTYDRLT